MNYLNNVKRDIFPDITDWKSNHDELRFAKDIKARPSKYYYFFHHMSYKITMWSFHILSMWIFFGISLYFFIINKILLLGILFAGLSLYKIKKIVSFAKDIQMFPSKNFYDIFMREW